MLEWIVAIDFTPHCRRFESCHNSFNNWRICFGICTTTKYDLGFYNKLFDTNLLLCNCITQNSPTSNFIIFFFFLIYEKVLQLTRGEELPKESKETTIQDNTKRKANPKQKGHSQAPPPTNKTSRTPKTEGPTPNKKTKARRDTSTKQG